tara:strand:- start:335 stop:1693 length:1359 start_codon:yes stop_codon:yes gene_type:complete
MSAIVSQTPCEILPINMPQNQEYSWRNGSSLIQLLIPQSPNMLMTDTIKLNGKLRLNKSTSTFQVPVFPDNSNRKGTGAYELRLNERVGINSLFENITISAMGSGGQTLEQVRNIGRMLATIKPLKHEISEFDGTLQSKDPSVASRKNLSAVEVNTEVFFSIDLEVAMLQGQNLIPIGVNGTRGLQILIQLANDNNALINPTQDDVFYSIVEPSLTYDILDYNASTTEEMMRGKTGQMSYNSYSHQYSVINASDTQLNLNFGTKNTLNVFSNTIPTTHINSLAKDGFSTDTFKNKNGAGDYVVNANLNRLTFGRNGVKMPYDFEMNTSLQAIENRPKVEVIEALKSAFDVVGSGRTLVSLNTENQIQTKVDLNGNEVASLDPTVNVQAQDNKCFGFGTSLDNISQVGRDYSTAVYSVRIESGLDGASPNSINTFTLARNTLTYSPQGISVSS